MMTSMQTLKDPNLYTQVKVLTNPIKSIICRHKFSTTETLHKCKVFPELMDLGCGVWQVAVQSVLAVNATQAKVKSVFDLKTNLTSSYKQVSGQPIAVDETLCSFGLNLPKNFDFNFYEPATKIFFTLNNRPSDTFKIYFYENELTKTAGSAYQLNVEIRLLFQRIV